MQVCQDLRNLSPGAREERGTDHKTIKTCVQTQIQVIKNCGLYQEEITLHLLERMQCLHNNSRLIKSPVGHILSARKMAVLAGLEWADKHMEVELCKLPIVNAGVVADNFLFPFSRSCGSYLQAQWEHHSGSELYYIHHLIQFPGSDKPSYLAILPRRLLKLARSKLDHYIFYFLIYAILSLS